MNPAQTEPGTTIANSWVAALKNVLASATSQEFQVTSATLQDGGATSANETPLFWWSQCLNTSSQPAMWVGAGEETWGTLGAAILASSGIEESGQQDRQAASRDLVARTNTALVQDLAKQFGAGISCLDLISSSAPSGTPVVVSISGADEFNRIELRLVLNDSVFAELLKSVTASPAQPASTTRPAWGNNGEPAGVLPRGIADLHLNLHVTLGRTTLPLESILKLSAGSIIDLGRSVIDPVDVVVNGTTIAAGQVVVCSGNYAVQIVPVDRNQKG